MIEIERKFLVKSNSFENQARSQQRIVQGFLSTHKERTVRVRIYGEQGFITVKGRSNEAGTTRIEWEKEITLQEAELLMSLCEDGIIEKTRYLVPVDAHLYEVDVFQGSNQGLIVAEIELNHETETFTKPVWLGDEVTGDPAYYNSQLSQHPFTKWNQTNH